MKYHKRLVLPIYIFNPPLRKLSYVYWFDTYFDIPQGIPSEKFTDEEARKYAKRMVGKYGQGYIGDGKIFDLQIKEKKIY